MLEQESHKIQSNEIALKLYDRWVRQRQNRPAPSCADDPKELEKLARNNFQTQVVEPRRQQLQELKRVANSITIGDKVALLVTMELPVLETSTLLHRLSLDLAEDPEAKFFSPVNQAKNCGSGCG